MLPSLIVQRVNRLGSVYGKLLPIHTKGHLQLPLGGLHFAHAPPSLVHRPVTQQPILAAGGARPSAALSIRRPGLTSRRPA